MNDEYEYQYQYEQSQRELEAEKVKNAVLLAALRAARYTMHAFENDPRVDFEASIALADAAITIVGGDK